MKKLILAAMTALPLFATATLAATHSDTGLVRKINHTRATLELADGKTFSIPKSIKLSAFKENEKVTVYYTMTNGRMLATSVVLAK